MIGQFMPCKTNEKEDHCSDSGTGIILGHDGTRLCRLQPQ